MDWVLYCTSTEMPQLSSGGGGKKGINNFREQDWRNRVSFLCSVSINIFCTLFFVWCNPATAFVPPCGVFTTAQWNGTLFSKLSLNFVVPDFFSFKKINDTSVLYQLSCNASHELLYTSLKRPRDDNTPMLVKWIHHNFNIHFMYFSKKKSNTIFACIFMH